LKLTSEEDEEATNLVTREVKRRKETDVVVKKALQLVKDIEIPAEVLANESTVEAAQLGLELTENLQPMIEVERVLKTAEDAQEEAVCSEAFTSEALEGNTDSHTAADEIILVESSTSSKTRTSSASL